MNLSGNNEYLNGYVCLDILKALVYVTMLLCDTLAFKVFNLTIFGLGTIAASGVIFVFAFALMNTISNVYGFEQAKRTLFITLMLQGIFCLIVSIVSRLSAEAVVAPGMSDAYAKIFNQSYKVIFSSTIAVFTGFYLNSLLLSIYKKHFYNRHYLSVYFIINSFSKAWLVTVSYTINFSDILDLHDTAQLIYKTWLFKISLGFVAIFTLTPLLIYLARRIDQKDIVDVGVSYSPYPFISDNFGKNIYKA